MNFRRGSADGLSLLFLIVWLAGDVFNILGAVLQGVLPTMIILAVYYTLADILLLGQCFYYRRSNIRGEFSPSSGSESGSAATSAQAGSEDDMDNAIATERSALLPKPNDHAQIQQPTPKDQNSYHAQHETCLVAGSSAEGRRHSVSSYRDLLHSSVDGTHLSPAIPFVDPTSDLYHSRRRRRISAIQSVLFNAAAIALVCAAGLLGWYISPESKASPSDPGPLTMDPLGQVFGYLCAVLYLGSRVPQLLLNFRRKSTDGVSLLFFLFACIGNLTYVLSIMAYLPICHDSSTASMANSATALSHHDRVDCPPGEAAALYGRYILVNLSWLVGSFGTLLLDMAIFVQFFLYRDGKSVNDANE